MSYNGGHRFLVAIIWYAGLLLTLHIRNKHQRERERGGTWPKRTAEISVVYHERKTIIIARHILILSRWVLYYLTSSYLIILLCELSDLWVSDQNTELLWFPWIFREAKRPGGFQRFLGQQRLNYNVYTICALLYAEAKNVNMINIYDCYFGHNEI